MVWRSIAMGVVFIGGLAEPAVWGVVLLVLVALLIGHLLEAVRR